MQLINPVVLQVTERITRRSRDSRLAYLKRMEAATSNQVVRANLSCGNLAHSMAACAAGDKDVLRLMDQTNIGIISAYNDLLSAHQPYEHYPQTIRQAVREMGSVAQFAAGVPAMCDGVTQGQPGMELSLFSRDVIALATAVALSHNLFDAGLCLGVCDKIVPGLLMGALSFGHLPFVLVPAGPMSSGLPNQEKARIRQLYAAGKVGRDALLACETAAYHSAGTCTFYGTANSNQLLVEVMGLHLPGASFVDSNGDLREQLTRAAARQAVLLSRSPTRITLAQIMAEKNLVNAMVALLATGGSTNHTMHLIAIAQAAGIVINWDDFSELSTVIPTLARIYPNGEADINMFHAAGGVPFLVKTLLHGGFLHEQVHTIMGLGLSQYTQEPWLKADQLYWRSGPETSVDKTILRSWQEPFASSGGLLCLTGNLGRSVIKVSAVNQAHWVVQAPAMVFDSQSDFIKAFEAGRMEQDLIVVVRFQGPRACGMPELHQLTPYLGLLQDRGFQVALVTDGRMSGASGKVPAAIQLYPEASMGGPIGKIKTGDLLRLNCHSCQLQLLIDDGELESRSCAQPIATNSEQGYGRELFRIMRKGVDHAELGAASIL